MRTRTWPVYDESGKTLYGHATGENWIMAMWAVQGRSKWETRGATYRAKRRFPGRVLATGKEGRGANEYITVEFARSYVPAGYARGPRSAGAGRSRTRARRRR